MHIKNALKLDWDETKRQAALRERGLDFADEAREPGCEPAHSAKANLVALIDWEAAVNFDDDRQDYGEGRQVCLGHMHDLVLVVAFTFRGDALRVISMRKANRRERKLHDGC